MRHFYRRRKYFISSHACCVSNCCRLTQVDMSRFLLTMLHVASIIKKILKNRTLEVYSSYFNLQLLRQWMFNDLFFVIKRWGFSVETGKVMWSFIGETEIVSFVPNTDLLHFGNQLKEKKSIIYWRSSLFTVMNSY